jgi:hypothetical protein
MKEGEDGSSLFLAFIKYYQSNEGHVACMDEVNFVRKRGKGHLLK